MSVRFQEKSQRYLVRVDRKGAPRISRLFKTKAEADDFEHEYLISHGIIKAKGIDSRKLKDLIDLWYMYQGVNLSDGTRRKTKLLYMCAELKNPVAVRLTPEKFVQYRFEKTHSNDKVIAAKTFNNMHGYLNAVYNKLHKLKVISYPSPVADVDFIKVHERQLSYLSHVQINTLLNSISRCQNHSTWYVAQICLRTGARWSEAEQLKRKQLHDGRVTFEFTKSKKTRTIPLDADFFSTLEEFIGSKNPDDRIFDNCISSFRRAVYRTDLSFPKGQMTHILRHSFASHFIMNGGNILTLQRILGHSDITVTMRYAHLAQDHLKEAINFNPMVDEKKVA